jgi:hypothetical protein
LLIFGDCFNFITIYYFVRQTAWVCDFVKYIKNINSGLARVMIVMTAICCWSMWIIVFLSQMNPLIKPEQAKEHGGCTIS